MLRTAVAIFIAGTVATLGVATRAQQPQVLRAGAYLVQVDAYLTRDGQPIRDLTADDFELLEDGKVQVIDSARFIEFPTWSPDQQRRDPNSQRESEELAGDPSHRLFVVYLNRMSWQLGNEVEPALMEFLDRTVGPDDYVAIMTALQSPGDLVFGQVHTSFKSEARRFLDVTDWSDPSYFTAPELELFTCYPGDEGLALIARWRADDLFRDLEGLIARLGAIRETRSTVIFVSPTMLDPAAVRQLTEPSREKPTLLTPGALMPPARGRGTFQVPGTEMTNGRCIDIKRAALETWPTDRFKELLVSARTANVAFNPINPSGLVADADLRVVRSAENANDLMRTMASETGGLAIVNLNDMRAGFRRVADSMTAHYVLSYYSSNKARDGRVRRLSVRLKASGEVLRARREYRAPREEEVTPPAGATVPAPSATETAVLQALAELDAMERAGGDRDVDQSGPAFFRAPSPPAAPWQPTSERRFSRRERLRVSWPAQQERQLTAARLLNRNGQALDTAVTLRGADNAPVVHTDLMLASLAPALYVIEAEFSDGTRAYVAFRISP